MSRASSSGTIPPKNVLVVDDEPQVAETLKMVLGIGGHSVEIAESAEAALAVYQPGKYDVVISDYSLGKTHGLDLARALRTRSPSQRIILITAYAETMATQKELLADIDCIIGKPFALAQLNEALATVCSEP